MNNSTESSSFLHELWLLSPEWQHIPPQQLPADASQPTSTLSCPRLTQRALASMLSRFLGVPTPPSVASPIAPRWSLSLSPNGACLAIIQHDRVIFRFAADGFAADYCFYPFASPVLPDGSASSSNPSFSSPQLSSIDPAFSIITAWNPSSSIFAISQRYSRTSFSASSTSSSSSPPLSSSSSSSSSSFSSPSSSSSFFSDHAGPLLILLHPSTLTPGLLHPTPLSLASCGLLSLSALNFGPFSPSQGHSIHTLLAVTQGGVLHRLAFDADARSLHSLRSLPLRHLHSASVESLSVYPFDHAHPKSPRATTPSRSSVHAAKPHAHLLVIAGSCLAGRQGVQGNISVWLLPEVGPPEFLAASTVSLPALSPTDRLLHRLLRLAQPDQAHSLSPEAMVQASLSPDASSILTLSRSGALQLWRLNLDAPESERLVLHSSTTLKKSHSQSSASAQQPHPSSSTSSPSESSSISISVAHSLPNSAANPASDSASSSSPPTEIPFLQHCLDAKWWGPRSIIVVSHSRTVGLYDPFDDWRLLSYHVEQFGADVSPQRHHLLLTNVAKDRCFLMECHESVAVVRRDSPLSNWDIIGFNDPSALLGGMFDATEQQWNPLEPQSSDDPNLRKIPKFTYRIIAYCKTSPVELLQRRLKQRRYDEALAVARNFQLDPDEVFMFRWTDQLQVIMSAPENIGMALDQVCHHPQWVLEQCATCSPTSLAAARAFFQYGMDRAQQELSQLLLDREAQKDDKRVDDTVEPILSPSSSSSALSPSSSSSLSSTSFTTMSFVDKRQMLENYITLFQCRADRLSVYEKILARTNSDFDPGTLSKFSTHSLEGSAKDFASQAEYSAVQVLLQEHSEELVPHLLEILDEIPCSAPPTSHQDLLPNLDLFMSSRFRPADVSEMMATEWYKARARRIERESGVAHFALDLLQIGLSLGFSDLAAFRERCEQFCILVYDCQLESLSLEAFEQLSPLELLKLHFGILEDAGLLEDPAVLQEVWVARKINQFCTHQLLVQLIAQKIATDGLRVVEYCRYLLDALILDPPALGAAGQESMPRDAARQHLQQICRMASRQLILANQHDSKSWLALLDDVRSVCRALFSDTISPDDCAPLVFESFLSVGKFAVASRILTSDPVFDQIALAISQDFLNSASALDDDGVDQAQSCLAILGPRPSHNAIALSIERERLLHQALALLRETFQLTQLAPLQLRPLPGNQRFEFILRLVNHQYIEYQYVPDLLRLSQLLGGDARDAKLHIGLAFLRRHLSIASSASEETPCFMESLILCKELVTIRYFPAFELCISLLRDCFTLIHQEELPSLITFSLAALSDDISSSSSSSTTSSAFSQNLEFLLNLWREYIIDQQQKQRSVLPLHSSASSETPVNLAELVESLYLEDLSLTISLLCTFSDTLQVESILQRADDTFPKLSPAQRALLASYVMAVRQTHQLDTLASPSSPSSLLDFISSSASEPNSSSKEYYDRWRQASQIVESDFTPPPLPSLDTPSSPSAVSSKIPSDINHQISELIQDQQHPQAAILLSQSSLNRLPLQLTSSSLPYNLLQLEIYLKTKSN